jgi:hypothetical protein
VPTYRYRGPHDAEPHVLVADSYEPEGANIVAFINATAMDGKPYDTTELRLILIVEGDIEIVE